MTRFISQFHLLLHEMFKGHKGQNAFSQKNKLPVQEKADHGLLLDGGGNSRSPRKLEASAGMQSLMDESVLFLSKEATKLQWAFSLY
jgi:hypothetical protein